MPTDWSRCPAVRTKPGYIAGIPALLDDPRVPVETVIVNMDEGMSAEEVVEMFGLKTPVKDVLSVYNYAKEQSTNAWPIVRDNVGKVVEAVDAATPGSYTHFSLLRSA